MKNIYILRHFKVKDNILKKMDSKDFESWVSDYDTFDLQEIKLDIPIVNKVYVSSQSRAIRTAEYLNLNYDILDDLTEVDAKAVISTKLKFSKQFWLIIGRLFWYFNIAKSEKREDTTKRANRFIKKIDDSSHESILVVSHGMFLKILVKELKKNGYSGKFDIRVQNSKIYKFQHR